MKLPSIFARLCGYQFALILACASHAVAQTPVTPATPTDFQQRDITGSTNAGVGIITKKPAEPKTITLHFTAVTPIRVWTNGEGKAMMARLLAYTAPVKGAKGPVEVIRKGKVRFLLEKTSKPIDYDIAKLSETDRTFIQMIHDAGRFAELKEGETKTAPMKEE